MDTWAHLLCPRGLVKFVLMKKIILTSILLTIIKRAREYNMKSIGHPKMGSGIADAEVVNLTQKR